MIVSDVRRRSDIAYFRRLSAATGVRLVLVRVQVADAIRVRRGWTFERGVDDVASECDLDAFDEWDVVAANEGAENGGQTAIGQLAGVAALIDECLL